MRNREKTELQSALSYYTDEISDIKGQLGLPSTDKEEIEELQNRSSSLENKITSLTKQITKLNDKVLTIPLIEPKIEVETKPEIEKELKIYSSFFDESLAKKSNISLYGFNGSGKTRLACLLASNLNKEGYWIVVFDTLGSWKETSDLPQVQVFEHYESIHQYEFSFLGESIIYDLSPMILDKQKAFMNEWCKMYWEHRRLNISDKPVLIVFEEAELYLKNIKSEEAQQIFRIVESGRNHPYHTRVMTISPRVSNVATEITEGSEQVYSGFTIGENNLRKVKSLFGKKWVKMDEEGKTPCEKLDVGEFIWRHGREIEKIKVPLFERKSVPRILPSPSQPKNILNLTIPNKNYTYNRERNEIIINFPPKKT